MDWLVERFASDPEALAFVHLDREMRYGEVVRTIEAQRNMLSEKGLASGDIVAVVGDYSPEVFCILIALALGGHIVVPLSREAVIEHDRALAISGCDWLIEFDGSGRAATVARHTIDTASPLIDQLRRVHRPGLVLFSSGSTGTPKGILHDFERVVDKFREPRAPVVAIPFLMIDHFGGINTILAITSNLGTVVTAFNRSVSAICEAIARHKVELLPATPSFLTSLVSSGIAKDIDLSSLKRITYGTEVMPQPTLDKLHKTFPNVELQQTYGLSEVGVLRSKSRGDGSLWVRVGGEGFETRVIDDILWIRSQYRMLGYLNAPSNFDSDGWFNTQDKVEVDGDWLRILGRVTDLINVGGQKVYPAEVEDVILQINGIEDVAVYGEAHPLVGQIVAARIVVLGNADPAELKRRIRKICRAQLAAFKVPSKVLVADQPLYTSRQKKSRKAQP